MASARNPVARNMSWRWFFFLALLVALVSASSRRRKLKPHTDSATPKSSSVARNEAARSRKGSLSSIHSPKKHPQKRDVKIFSSRRYNFGDSDEETDNFLPFSEPSLPVVLTRFPGGNDDENLKEHTDKFRVADMFENTYFTLDEKDSSKLVGIPRETFLEKYGKYFVPKNKSDSNVSPATENSTVEEQEDSASTEDDSTIVPANSSDHKILDRDGFVPYHMANISLKESVMMNETLKVHPYFNFKSRERPMLTTCCDLMQIGDSPTTSRPPPADTEKCYRNTMSMFKPNTKMYENQEDNGYYGSLSRNMTVCLLECFYQSMGWIHWNDNLDVENIWFDMNFNRKRDIGITKDIVSYCVDKAQEESPVENKKNNYVCDYAAASFENCLLEHVDVFCPAEAQIKVYICDKYRKKLKSKYAY